MKNNRIILSLFTLMCLFSSCGEDFLDVNQDPLVSSSADPNLIFTEVLVNMSNNRTVELTLGAGSVLQYYEGVFGVFNDVSIGVVSPFTNGNTWSNYYVTGLKNLSLVRQNASTEETNFPNVVAQAKILEAMLYMYSTIIWEDIPFSQAIQAEEFPQPIFDRQEDVLRGIISLLDEALGLIDENDPVRVEGGDLLYGGDLSLWIRMANSMKLKTAMMIANKDESISSVISGLASAPMVEEVSQEAQLEYLDAPGNRNPYFTTFQNFASGTNPDWWVASTTLFNILASSNDPRLHTYFDESNDASTLGTGNYGEPAAPGTYVNCTNCAIVSFNVNRADMPDRYMLASEILLLKAEATLRGFLSGGADEADALMRRGIRASMDYFDDKPGTIQNNDKETYINSIGQLSGMSEAEALETIRMQLYIANFNRMAEAWGEWKRTHVPDLNAPIGSVINGVLRRFPYAPDEQGANPNAPANKLLQEPMWYEN